VPVPAASEPPAVPTIPPAPAVLLHGWPIAIATP